jgi:PPOX class probable F420-dependent enzyme
MGQMTDAERDAFLARPRYGILSSLRADGSPVAVPVWFDWDGDVVRMFTHEATPKLKRLARDPRASLLVTNYVDEPEKWVAFDGPVSVCTEGGLDLALRLAGRYWDTSDPGRAAALEEWRTMASAWRLLELVPQRIRTYVD